MNLMEIVYKNIDELIKYKNNPRNNKNSIPEVAKSIQKYGFKVPIIIDDKNVIVTGHTRYEASKMLNLKEVPCIVVKDLSEEQIKAFRLADNKVSEYSEWDYEKLINEIKKINDDFIEELHFIEDLDIDDDDFIDEIKSVSEKKEKEYICPECGEIFK